ncbi:Integrator complex subunit 2 [Schistosoma japonicum]|nr:Integrator complex subunit 2 [Schistosoma japonicum]
MIFEKSLTCDFSDITPDEVLIFLPILYQSGDFMHCVSEVSMTHDRRHLLCNLFSILNSLSNLKIPVIWEEICTECSVAHTSSFPSLILNYESQTACGKMKTLMRLIVHLCNDKPTSKCSLESCCELMESEALEAEVFIILCFIFHGLSNRCLIGNFFCGYLAHCNNVNHSILMKLAVNFSSDWWHIFNELWKFGKYIAARSSNHGSDLQDRSWSLYLQDPDTGIIAHLDPHSLSYRIQTVLFCLIKLNPRDAVIVMENCIIGRQFPGLVLDLLFGLSSSWYLDKLSQYFIKVTVNLTPRDPTIPLDDSRILTALILLRVLAAFRGFINYNFPPELSQKLLTLLTHRTIVSERGLQYISYSLAFLIGLRSSLATGISSDTSSNGSTLNRLPANTDIENIIVNWLQRLLDEQDIFNSLTQSSSSSYLLSYNQCPKTTSYIEPLLLLAILFHTNQPGPITELISSLLGLRIPSLGRTINGWRKLFFQTVFTENKWIIGQIRESVRPVHPSLPELIEAHVTHSFSSNSNAVSSMNDVPTIIGTVSTPASSSTAYINLSLISEQELIIEFSNPKSSGFIQFCAPEVISKSKNDMSTLTTEQDFTPQLLFLYYAFYVFDYQFTSRLAANRSRLPDEPSCIYSNRLWDVIPITCLLQYARAHLSDYLTNHFPHLTMGEMMIQDELLLDSIWRSDHEPTRVISINIAEINISMNTTPSPPITIVTSRVMASHKRNVRQDLDYLLSFNEEQLNQAFNQVITKLSVSSMESSSNNLSEICSLWKNLIYMINQLIQSIEIFGLDCLLKYGPVIAEQCPRLLLLQGNEGFLSTNRKFIHSIELLWRRLHLIMPRRLELITMNRIRSNNTVTNLSSSTTSTMNPLDLLIEKANSLITKQKALSSLDLCTDPVENVMSEVDKKVFR